MARALVNIASSPRLAERNFSEVATDVTLGPEVKPSTVSGEAIEASRSEAQSVNQWVAMTQADQGLLDAIYNFINTTKEGTSVPPDISKGRTKKLFFNFQGFMGKSIRPGEIGQFEVNFSYPPQTKIGSIQPLGPAVQATANNPVAFTA